MRLARQGIAYQLAENAFVDIADFPRAQALADQIRVEKLHRRLDRLARRFCPVLRHFPSGSHWSIHQAENATDIVFKHQSDLKPLYEALVRTASMRSRLRMSPPSSVAPFDPTPRTRSVTISRPVSKALASATRWAPRQSRRTTSSVS